jgi:hypothetical protein
MAWCIASPAGPDTIDDKCDHPGYQGAREEWRWGVTDLQNGGVVMRSVNRAAMILRRKWSSLCQGVLDLGKRLGEIEEPWTATCPKTRQLGS